LIPVGLLLLYPSGLVGVEDKGTSHVQAPVTATM